MRLHQITLNDDLYKFASVCVAMGVDAIQNNDHGAAELLNWLEFTWAGLSPQQKLDYVITLKTQFTPDRVV